MSASGPRVKESAVSVKLRQGTEERMRKDGRSIWSVFGSVFGGVFGGGRSFEVCLGEGEDSIHAEDEITS